MFLEGGGFVNITVPEGGPTATGMNPEGGTAIKSCRPPPQVNFCNSSKFELKMVAASVIPPQERKVFTSFSV